MTKIQRMAVGKLYSLFGGCGPKYTKGNCHFLTMKLTDGKDAEHYQPTAECKEAFDAVMRDDWSSLHVRDREKFEAMKAKEERFRKVVGLKE